MAPEKINNTCRYYKMWRKLNFLALYTVHRDIEGIHVYTSLTVHCMLIIDSPNSHKYSCTPTECHNHIHCIDTGWNHIVNSLDHNRHPVQRWQLSIIFKACKREREGGEGERERRLEMIAAPISNVYYCPMFGLFAVFFVFVCSVTCLYYDSV